MSEQDAGKLSKAELDVIQHSDALVTIHGAADRIDGIHRQRRRLLGHIAYQVAEIERLKQRLLTAAGDDLCRLTQDEIKDLTGGKVPIPPKEEFLASCERFHAQIAAESGVNHNCLTLAQLVAENERLTKELGEATAKLDSLKLDQAKREEFIVECHGRFQAGFLEEYRFVWRAHGEQFRAGFAAAIDHAFAAGLASAPEVAELQRQLEETNKRLAELTKDEDWNQEEFSQFIHEEHLRHNTSFWNRPWHTLHKYEQDKYRDIAPGVYSHVAARVRAPLLQQIAELTAKLEAAEKRAIWNRNEIDAMLEHFDRRTKNRDEWKEVALRLEADRDRLAAELAAEKQNHQATAELLGLVSRNPKRKLAEARDHSVDANKKVEPLKAAASIKSLRLYFCQGMKQFAEHCGIKPSDWARVEQGEVPITTDRTIELALQGLAAIAEQWRIERGDFGREQPEEVEPPASEPAPYAVWWKDSTGNIHKAGSFSSPEKAHKWGAKLPLSCSWRVVGVNDSGAEKVEPPASEARQFVCPKCGGTEHGTRSDYSIYCLRGYALGCGWSGTWAEVEAAKGDAQTEVLSDAFRAAAEIEVATPITVGLTGSSALGVEVNELKQQLAAERQAREAADRQATEKILELERRCNDEHYKCEAAEQRAEQAEVAAVAMRKAISSRLIEVEEMVARGKGTWPEKDYIRDDVWARWQGELLVLRSLNEKALTTDAGRAAANELRALRTFRAEIEQDYQAWANATIGEAELRIRLGVARNKVDKAIAGQGEAGKEG